MPLFLTKTYEMVDDPSSDALVSWSATNHSFIVWDPIEFAKDVLPKYFKHGNFSSFIRQLNTYGFRKVCPIHWEFANKNFIRDQPDLLKNITRRKPVHSHSPQNHVGQGEAPLAESERQSLKDEIEKLKNEKEQLLEEIQRNELKWKMHFHSSKDRLEKLEQKQKTVISSISQVLQKPEVASTLESLIENMDKKLGFPESSHFNNIDASMNDSTEASQMYFSNNGSIGDPMETSEMLPSDTDNAGGSSTSVYSSNMEIRMDLLESSMMFLENVVNDVGGNSLQTHLNIDLDESITCVDDPSSISSVQLINVEVQPKSPEINMSTVEPVVPASPDLVSLIEQEVEVTTMSPPVNDQFWELNVEVQPNSPEVNMSDEPAVPASPDLVSLLEQELEVTTMSSSPVNDPFWDQFMKETLDCQF